MNYKERLYDGHDKLQKYYLSQIKRNILPSKKTQNEKQWKLYDTDDLCFEQLSMVSYTKYRSDVNRMRKAYGLKPMAWEG